ncbi:MAG: hypothetical protein QXK37_04235 [Candidatus Woesearchaeota archaeon]
MAFSAEEEKRAIENIKKELDKLPPLPNISFDGGLKSNTSPTQNVSPKKSGFFSRLFSKKDDSSKNTLLKGPDTAVSPSDEKYLQPDSGQLPDFDDFLSKLKEENDLDDIERILEKHSSGSSQLSSEDKMPIEIQTSKINENDKSIAIPSSDFVPFDNKEYIKHTEQGKNTTAKIGKTESMQRDGAVSYASTPAKTLKEIKAKEKILLQREKALEKRSTEIDAKERWLSAKIKELEEDKQEIETREDEIVELVKKLENEFMLLKKQKEALDKINDEIRVRRDETEKKSAEVGAKELEIKNDMRVLKEEQEELQRQKAELQKDRDALLQKEAEAKKLLLEIQKEKDELEKRKSKFADLEAREKKVRDDEKNIRSMLADAEKYKVTKSEVKRMEEVYARLKERLKQEYKRYESLKEKMSNMPTSVADTISDTEKLFENKGGSMQSQRKNDSGFAKESRGGFRVKENIQKETEEDEDMDAGLPDNSMDEKETTEYKSYKSEGLLTKGENVVSVSLIRAMINDAHNLLMQKKFDDAGKKVSNIMEEYNRLPDSDPTKKEIYYSILSLRNEVKLALVE